MSAQALSAPPGRSIHYRLAQIHKPLPSLWDQSHKDGWTKPLRGMQYHDVWSGKQRNCTGSPTLGAVASALKRCLQQLASRKRAFYDTSSTTHDRGYAGEESLTAHPSLLRATGLAVCTPLW